MEENKILEKIKTAFSHAAAPSADGKEIVEVLDTCRAYENEKKKLRFRHAFRVTAAAYTETVIKLAGKDYPQGDAIDFVLDRPFLFAVVSDTGTISFVGEVNRP